MPRRTASFQSIRTDGVPLPSDLLRRIVDPNNKLPGITSTAFGLPSGERLNDAITQSWTRLGRHWTEFIEAAPVRAIIPLPPKVSEKMN